MKEQQNNRKPEIELNEKQRAVLDIAKTFVTANGGIDWKAAWQARPDYQKLLRYNNQDHKNQQAYNIGFDLRRKGLIGATPASRNAGRKKARPSRKETNGKNGNHDLSLIPRGRNEEEPPSTTIHVSGEDQPKLLSEAELERLINKRVAAEVSNILNEVGFCPRCGKDVKIHTMLEMTRNRH